MNTDKVKHIFLRHGRLASPYDNYENMSLLQLRNLADETFHPVVDKLFVSQKFPNIQRVFLPNLPVHFHVSPSDRAQQTANILQSLISPTTTTFFETNPDLREISFRLDHIYPDEELLNLSLLNSIILDGVARGHSSIEPYPSVYSRANQIIESAKNAPEGTHIYITHDFFMRVLDISTHRGDVPKSVTPSELKSTDRNDYLEGFTCDANLTYIDRVVNKENLT